MKIIIRATLSLFVLLYSFSFSAFSSEQEIIRNYLRQWEQEIEERGLKKYKYNRLQAILDTLVSAKV